MRAFLRILCSAFLCFSLAEASAQCPTGYTATSLNWDALAFLIEGAGNVTNTIATNQKFAFSKNLMTITHNYSAANTLGDNTTHTASSSNGADIQFVGNGYVKFTFQNELRNVKFSIYDVDLSQSITITASNGTIAQPITTFNKVSGNVLTINGSGTNTATATASNTAVALASTDGAVNVFIAGPITSFTVTVSATVIDCKNKQNCNEDGSFFISDIEACSMETSFPSATRQIAKPYTGQPGYVLTARDQSVYMVDPATGIAKYLFTDPDNKNINSMAYDPTKHILYYTNSLTLSGGVNPDNRTVKKYDFNTEAPGILIPNVTTSLNIPTYGSGVESGGASFYDGALYLGVEGEASGRSIVWRIDFDGSLNPISAKQAFGIATTGHDWGDFVIANGTLYDFDGGSNGNENVFHLNLQTGAYNSSYGKLPFSIRQVAADWNDQIYNIGGAPAGTGEVAPYNYNGTVDAAKQKIITEGTTTPTGSWGDAAEAFKPKADFGDAPESYDPDPNSPALHEKDVNLKLGDRFETEWNKLSISNADVDDDGLKFVRILNQGGGNYEVTAKVFNNTGKNAIVGAWVDFNGNGQYDSNEGITTTVGSNTTTQEVSLYWQKITANLPDNSHTYLRVRVTSESTTRMMTTADATGYFTNGEVEDWYVPVNVSILPLQLTGFSAKKINAKVQIEWSVAEESIGTTYELQKSINGVHWNTIYTKQAAENAQSAAYSFNDAAPYQPKSYYRLKYSESGSSAKYSIIQQLAFQTSKAISIFPNPVYGQATLSVDALKEEVTSLFILDANGKKVVTKSLKLGKGSNSFTLPVQQLTTGVYYVQVYIAGQLYLQKLMVQKN